MPWPIPVPDPTQFTVAPHADVAMYPYGSANTPPLDINEWGTPVAVQDLVIRRPFQFRIEPRFIGGKALVGGREKQVGSKGLDVIFTPRVFMDLMDTEDFDDDDAQWDQLTHRGALDGNKELAQVGQHATFGHGDFLHPTTHAPILWRYLVDFQLDRQNAPKLTLWGSVRVWRDGAPNIPVGAIHAGD